MSTHQNACAKETLLRIRKLNDQLRKTGTGGMVLITPGIEALDDETRFHLFQDMKTFTDFTEANDPYGEHDFGKIKTGGISTFWKIDYYDLELIGRSPDPSNAELTCRALTLMLSSEY